MRREPRAPNSRSSPKLHCRKYGVFSVPLGKVFRLTARGHVGAPADKPTHGEPPERKIVWKDWFACTVASTALSATPGATPMPPTCPLIPPTKTGAYGGFIAPRSATCAGMMSLKTPPPAWTAILFDNL